MPHSGSAFATSSNISLGLAIPERMLVSHPSIEAALRSLVARRHEMDGAKSLIRFILRECWLRG